MSEFTFGEFEELVRNFEGPLLVCFYKEDSMNDNYKHFIERIIKDIGDKINIIKVDVTDNPSIQHGYNLSSFPDLNIFYNGNKVWGFGCGIYSSAYVEHTVDFVKIRNSFNFRVRDIDLCGTVLS